MAYSAVPRIELNNDGTVELYVSVYGYDEGSPVEISGYITQASGSVGYFIAVQEIPRVDADEEVLLKFTVPISPGRLVMGEAVTVIVRVTDAWVTVLEPMASAESSSWRKQSTTTFAAPGKPSPDVPAETPPDVPAETAQADVSVVYSPVGPGKRWRPPRGYGLAGRLDPA